MSERPDPRTEIELPNVLVLTEVGGVRAALPARVDRNFARGVPRDFLVQAWCTGRRFRKALRGD